MTQYERKTTGDNSYGSTSAQSTPTVVQRDSQNYPYDPSTGQISSQYDNRTAVNNNALSTPGNENIETGANTEGRKVPKVLLDMPQLEGDGVELLARHRTNRIPPKSGLEKQLVERHDGLMEYYAFMARIDPTSGTFDPPAHDLVPMPRGGLDTLVEKHLGRRPVVDEFATPDERMNVVEAQRQWDVDFNNYRHLLFRMNADTLRVENRYVLSQPVRVPNELVEDNR